MSKKAEGPAKTAKVAPKPAKGIATGMAVPTQKAARKEIDWEAVEMQYRAGIRSLKEIGKEFGVSDAGIIKRARRDEWTRAPREASKRAVVLKQKTPLCEQDRSGFVYVIYIDTGHERLHKIGMAKTFGDRLSQHQCSSPFEIRVACCYFVGNMRMEERELHDLFKGRHLRGEWYALTDDDLRLIARRSLLSEAA